MALDPKWKEKIAQGKKLLYILGFSEEEVTTMLVLTSKEPKLLEFLKYLESGQYQTKQDIRNKAAEISSS